MLSENVCGDECPENADEQCQWDSEEKMCFCADKTCKDFSKDECESNACPQDATTKCLWNDKTEACQCGKSCTMLSEKECGDECPENADEQCQWDSEEKMCFCADKTCKDFSKDECESNACPQDATTRRRSAWNGEKEECVSRQVRGTP
ncbi:hypothetical protein DIPPA_02660 [Diplonema papillatum]|nr:hypothetical protein DIPPA_02660 [Diplonema papillatum]